MDIDELAAAYLSRDHAKYDWEPEREFWRMLAEDPDTAWRFVDAAVKASRTVDELGSVGAGPLEEVIGRYGASFADELIVLVQGDPRWAYATTIVRGAPGAEEAQEIVRRQWPAWEELRAAAARHLREAPP